MEETIKKEIEKLQVIDLHTHLFPKEFNNLFLFGIDNLLTYHYLISELFIIWKEYPPKEFYKFTKKKQAEIIWDQLFVLRTPISEATKGILTICNKLGLGDFIKKRDLNGLRNYFNNIKINNNLNEHIENIFNLSNVKYLIMTNEIFNELELKIYEKDIIYNRKRFKTSLRVDKLLIDYDKCLEIVKNYNYGQNIEGVKQYLRHWYNKLNPEYLMLSIPYNFKYHLEDKNSNFIFDKILIPMAIEFNLPIALKFGTYRKLNPELKDAGDSVGVAFVDSLSFLCRDNPKCNFLATFLSRNNQHQLCAIARIFPNLHIYGCWWFLNNPSLIQEITEMRIEMLGFGFTAQHSDSRILEQLIYKWDHFKKIITKILIKKYKELLKIGWNINEIEIKRDVNYLFGGSYKQFVKKNIQKKSIK